MIWSTSEAEFKDYYVIRIALFYQVATYSEWNPHEIYMFASSSPSSYIGHT
jgi:hypothetical protein